MLGKVSCKLHGTFPSFAEGTGRGFFFIVLVQLKNKRAEISFRPLNEYSAISKIYSAISGISAISLGFASVITPVSAFLKSSILLSYAF